LYIVYIVIFCLSSCLIFIVNNYKKTQYILYTTALFCHAYIPLILISSGNNKKIKLWHDVIAAPLLLLSHFVIVAFFFFTGKIINIK